MKNVVRLDDYRRDKIFEDDVCSFMFTMNPTFEHYKQDSKAVFYFHHKIYIYIFMSYVPAGTKTSLPTIQESFHNITHHPRVSKGEWVVDSLDQIDPTRAKSLFPMIYAKEKDPDFIEILRTKIRKKAK